MPVYGSGIVPAAGAVQAELTALTRRAFIPKMYVQIYNTCPALAALFAHSQTAYGGVSSVTAPVQGAPYVNTSQTDYSGTFAQPAQQQGAFPAEFNLKASITPIPFYGMEAALQFNHAVIPIVEARMNDSVASQRDFLGNALYNNFSNNLQMIGFPGAIDDGTNLVTYGNINRTANTWWQSKVYAAGSVAPTRKLVFQYTVGVNKNGAEMPTFGLMGFGTFANLANDFIGNESYQIQPGMGFDSDADRPRAAFRALDVGGVPIYGDPYCPEGILYLINANYINLYVHEQAAFSFTGFESLLSNYQLGYIGAVLTLCELVNVKPRAHGRVSGFTFLTI
jgi:hypothetical protein